MSSKQVNADTVVLKGVSLLNGTADPTAGGGVVAAIGSKYFRGPGTAGDYTKTAAGNTAWTQSAHSIYTNVLDYGATGDGVTDDRAAIQSAITAAAVIGGCVYFPQGTYLCSRVAAQAYSFDITGMNSIRFLGSGFGGATITMSGNAGSTAWDLFLVRGASTGIEWEDLTFSQAGVVSPLAGSCNMLHWGDGSTAAQFVKATRCRFSNGVAGGYGIKIEGNTSHHMDSWWIAECEIRDMGTYGVYVGDYATTGWIVDNEIATSGTTEIYIASAAGAIDDIKICGNELTSTASGGIALSISGDTTTRANRIQIADNVILGSVYLKGLKRSQMLGNAVYQATAAVTAPVVQLDGANSDIQISTNVISRVSTTGNGYCLSVSNSAANLTLGVQIQRNVFMQEITGQECVFVRSASNIQFSGNMIHYTNAGATSTVAATFASTSSAAVSNLQITGNNISAEAGTFLAAILVLATTDAVSLCQINGNMLDNVDTGVFYTSQTGGTFTNEYQLAGNTINAVTADYTISGATLYLRTGGNACTTGPNVWSGSGTPEGNVTATVGSTYQRRDGGPSSTFYYKESGTGNTGWVAIGGSQLVFGTGDTTAVATAVYPAPGYIATATATEVQLAVTRVGTLRNLRVRGTGAGVGTQNVVYTVRKNGADTAITVTVANDAASPNLTSDTTHTVVVAAGDLISLSIVKAAGVTSGQTNVFATLELA